MVLLYIYVRKKIKLIKQFLDKFEFIEKKKIKFKYIILFGHELEFEKFK